MTPRGLLGTLRNMQCPTPPTNYALEAWRLFVSLLTLALGAGVTLYVMQRREKLERRERTRTTLIETRAAFDVLCATAKEMKSGVTDSQLRREVLSIVGRLRPTVTGEPFFHELMATVLLYERLQAGSGLMGPEEGEITGTVNRFHKHASAEWNRALAEVDKGAPIPTLTAVDPERALKQIQRSGYHAGFILMLPHLEAAEIVPQK